MQYVRFQREQRIKNAREKIVLVVVIMKHSTEFLSENSELAARKILTKNDANKFTAGRVSMVQRFHFLKSMRFLTHSNEEACLAGNFTCVSTSLLVTLCNENSTEDTGISDHDNKSQ